MKPFFKHFGSKYRLAAGLPPPRYPLVIEPFAGGAGYSVHYAPKVAWLNDLDPAICALWTWFRDGSSTEGPTLPTQLPAGLDIRSIPVSRPAQEFIRRWQRVGQVTSWTVSKWGTGDTSGLWGRGVRDRAIRQAAQIAGWHFAAVPYWEIPNVEATWLIDPPYQGYPKVYDFEGSGGINYEHLSQWCRSRKGQVIVCEFEGADWLPFRHISGSVNNRPGLPGTKKDRRGEAVWIRN